MNAEEEVRASLVADLNPGHVFYCDAEYEADELIWRMKKEWAEAMILAITNPANRAGLGWESAVDVIRSIHGLEKKS